MRTEQKSGLHQSHELMASAEQKGRTSQKGVTRVLLWLAAVMMQSEHESTSRVLRHGASRTVQPTHLFICQGTDICFLIPYVCFYV